MADPDPCTWHYSIAVNESVPGWRGVLGRRLRTLATMVDGKNALTIEIETTPSISRKEEAACLIAGFEHANELLKEAARNAACEQYLQRKHPELYPDE